jgi:ferredoxin-NADP reductase
MEYKVKIKKIETLATDVKSFKLEKPENYTFKPGQFTVLSINKPELEKKKRPISFASPENDDFVEFVIKQYPRPESQSITAEMHKLEQGDELTIGGPMGNMSYKGAGTFLAGGVGIMPFVCMLKALNESEIKDSSIIASFRTDEDILLEKEVKEIFKSHPENVEITLTRQENPDYSQGRISIEMLKAKIKNNDQFFYICGPQLFITDLKDNLKSIGISEDKIITEGR